MELKNIVLANGRVLLKKTEYRNIYEVINVAKNNNYQGLGKNIEIGDSVIADEYLYHSIKIKSGEYFIVTSKQIVGYIKD